MIELVRQMSEDLARFYSPPWWRLLARRRWKRDGTKIAADRLKQALTGEIEPIRRLVVEVRAVNDPV